MVGLCFSLPVLSKRLVNDCKRLVNVSGVNIGSGMGLNLMSQITDMAYFVGMEG